MGAGRISYPPGGSGGSGDVTGPSASTDNAIVRWDGITGKIIQDYTSGAPTITDVGYPTFQLGMVINETGADSDTRIEGDTQANLFCIDASADAIGINTNAPTNSLTLASSTTGIAFYNTSDQTTNFERARLFWESNIQKFVVDAGGSGTLRPFRLATRQGGVDESYIQLGGDQNPHVLIQKTNQTGYDFTGIVATLTNAEGMNALLRLSPTINQSSTSSYAALAINVTESATGSGSKMLIQAATGGSIKFGVSSVGNVTIVGGSGTLNINSTSDGGDYNIFTANGTQTLAIYGSAGNQLNVSLLDGTLTLGNTLIFGEGINLQSGTTTGTKIGTATTQKLGFYNATPIVRPSAWTLSGVVPNLTFNAGAATTAQTAQALGTLIQQLEALGLVG